MIVATVHVPVLRTCLVLAPSCYKRVGPTDLAARPSCLRVRHLQVTQVAAMRPRLDRFERLTGPEAPGFAGGFYYSGRNAYHRSRSFSHICVFRKLSSTLDSISRNMW